MWYMMKSLKDTLVVFTDTNARIITNPGDIERFKDDPNVVINPDFSHVKGIAPHYWLKDGNDIKPMNEEQRLERDAHHDKTGIRGYVVKLVYQDRPVDRVVHVDRPVFVNRFVNRASGLLASAYVLAGALSGSALTLLVLHVWK
jgi:hypothetical protein